MRKLCGYLGLLILSPFIIIVSIVWFPVALTIWGFKLSGSEYERFIDTWLFFKD